MQLTKHWAATLDDYVIDLAWSPDGTQLAAASAAGPVTLFAADDGGVRHELPGHADGTNCLAWAPSVIAAGAVAAKVAVVAGVGDPGFQRESPESPTPATAPTPATILATGGQDGAVKFWDTAAGQHTATAALGNAWVEHLAWRPSAGTAASGTPPQGSSRPAAAPLLFAAAGRELRALGPDGSVRHAFPPAPKTIAALAWEPAGGCAAVAYFGGICLWDADDFVVQKELPYGNGINALVWSPDGKWLVSGNQDPSVHLWIPADDIELHMSGYEGKVRHLSFDRTSRWLATSGGRDACVWDCSGAGPEGREPAMLPHDAPICALAFQQAHGLLVSASTDGVVQLWSPERKQPLRATVRMPARAAKLAWSPDDRHLAIGSVQGAVYVLRCEE
jgi:WD40 repeat protein